VSVSPDHLQELASICEGAQLFQEGPQEYVHLKKLNIRVGGVSHVVDAILSPVPHTGYTTRLFLSQSFPSRGANWSAHQILGRQWHTWSWQGVPADLSPMQILLCHLDALK
jgi:hypothetical protein